MASLPTVDGAVEAPTGQGTPEKVARAARFLMKLAGALHTYGMPAHRLELALEQIGDRMGVTGRYMVTPTSIVASIGPEGAHQTFLHRCAPGRVNLEKQTALHQLISDVGDRRLTLEEAVEILDSLKEDTGPGARLRAIAGFALAAAATAVFFDGGSRESLAAGLVGLAIGTLVQLATRSRRLAIVLPGLAGLTAALVGALAQVLLGPVFSVIPILAGLIILIPSLNLTIAVNELAHSHLVAGTARLGGVLMAFLQIAFGVVLGNKLLAQFGLEKAPLPQALPVWALAVAVVVAAVASTVLFKARTRDLPVILLTMSISFAGSRLASMAFGPEVGVLLGAWLMGSVAHLVGRWRNHPSAVGILPGILPLLPGGLGFQTFSALAERDVLAGFQTGVTMLFVALSLVTGLLLSSLTSRSHEAF